MCDSQFSDVAGFASRSWLRGAIVALLALTACGCGSDNDSDISQASQAKLLAILSAFPAELAPHLERATIQETMVINGHVFRRGMLQGVPVILALTGIGLANADETTTLLFERFDVRGVVVSAVVGSTTLRIGDVAVPLTWQARDKVPYSADAQWVELAREIAAAGTASLERCTMVPSKADGPVCLTQDPAIVVGGVGMSTDPYHGNKFACQPGGGDLYGCDVDAGASASGAGASRDVVSALAAADAEEPVVEDQETAAVAREAAAHGVPFIAFRAVSDGLGDPLNLPGGFLGQFTAYYHLAARNAAAATVAFLDRLSH